MTPRYIYGAEHQRTLPEFTRSLDWFKMPLAQKLARLEAHALACPEDVPTRREIERLERLDSPTQLPEALRQETANFLAAFDLAFTTGDVERLKELARAQPRLRARHKAIGSSERFDFDRVTGEVIERCAQPILTMAGVLGRLPLVLGFEDRAGEYSTRDFTVNLHGVGDVDGDSKVTFGRSIVLEMSTRTKEQGWFVRMPDGECILSARFGWDGSELLWVPVDALREVQSDGLPWYIANRLSDSQGRDQVPDGKGGVINLLPPHKVSQIPEVVNLNEAWQECARLGLLKKQTETG